MLYTSFSLNSLLQLSVLEAMKVLQEGSETEKSSMQLQFLLLLLSLLLINIIRLPCSLKM